MSINRGRPQPRVAYLIRTCTRFSHVPNRGGFDPGTPRVRNLAYDLRILGHSLEPLQIEDRHAMLFHVDDLLFAQGPQHAIDVHHSQSEVTSDLGLCQWKVVSRAHD